ncbi:MAG TPA: glycosyltransferase family 4 protein [Candidatus Angelobacter sp.]|nr:glycosyltransferase family 4 protein [Candidatus Angelobacter sp.]
MKIALIAPPFIAVPPKKYGGTELFISELASSLSRQGIDVTVYANGESTVPVELRWIYEKENWPIRGEVDTSLKGLNHAAWAVKEAAGDADIIHLNSACGLSFSRYVETPLVYTVHHAHEPELTDYYMSMSPDISYVSISDFQRSKLPLARIQTIHHGIDPNCYRIAPKKRPYLSFLGRIAPSKGTHIAIEIAKLSGIPLKIAGEIQPAYTQYWEHAVRPHIDGRFIEYIGEIGLEEKNELLGSSMAMLFPIQWDEPFGLVMIEAMACGTPVLATPGGSVREVVEEGISGYVRFSPSELADCARELKIAPETVRQHFEQHFSVDRMAEDYSQLYSEVLSGSQRDMRSEHLAA